MPKLTEISNITAEKCLIASMLAEQEVIPDIQNYVQIEDFSSEYHQDIVKTIFNLFAQEKNVTIPNIINSLSNDDGGTASYLLTLVQDYPTASGYEEHARIVQDKSVIRKLASGTLELAQKLTDPLLSGESALDLAEQILLKSKPQQYSSAQPLFQEDDFEIYAKMIKYPTGWNSLDSIYTPTEGNLCVIGADTNVGKTTLALNLALNYALKGHKILFFSCEMGRLDIAMKAYSYLTLGLQREIKKAFYNNNLTDSSVQETRRQILDAKESKETLIRILSENFKIRPGNVSIEEAQREVSACGFPKIIFVDYIQEMKTHRGHSRYVEIAEVATGLKQIAMNHKHPGIVFVMSQLTRAKDNKGLTLDVKTREASDILNKSDAFLELIDMDYKPGEPSTYRPKTNMQLNVRKNRMGPKGSINLKFYGDYQIFVEPWVNWVDNLLYEKGITC